MLRRVLSMLRISGTLVWLDPGLVALGSRCDSGTHADLTGVGEQIDVMSDLRSRPQGLGDLSRQRGYVAASGWSSASDLRGPPRCAQGVVRPGDPMSLGAQQACSRM